MNKEVQGFKNIAMALAVALFFVDLYYYCFSWFEQIGLIHPLLFTVMKIFINTGIFKTTYVTKILIIVFVGCYSAFERGKLNKEKDTKDIIYTIISSTLLFMSNVMVLAINNSFYFYGLYSIATLLFLISKYQYLSRLINLEIMEDRFNLKNKIFPQQKEKIDTELSVNIPYKFVKGYDKKGEDLMPIYENGYINFLSPDRATLILGKPGSGKSYSINEEFIRQHIEKAFSIVNYDFKFPTLTNIAYNYFKLYENNYAQQHSNYRFEVINVDQPQYSVRCNPIAANLLNKKADAIDAVNTIFLNLDKKSGQNQNFFTMSANSITTAILWFLKKYEDGKFCSFPHLIEFISQPDEEILPILADDKDLIYFVSAFADALKKEAFEQLAGQTASARIPLGKIATREMFYVMTDPDNTGVDLRINRKEEVVLLNIGNAPETQKTNAPALGLYISQIAKLVNKHNRVPCSFQVDELPTIYINGLDELIATGRSNKICTVITAQDYTQLVRDYGKENADAIYNTVGSIVSGQVATDTAKKISDSIGKINYKNQSVSINKDSTSTSYSTQRDALVPPDEIAQLSQGEMVGVLADKMGYKLKTKVFKGIVSPDKSTLGNLEYPVQNENLTSEVLDENVEQIRKDIRYIIDKEKQRMQIEKEEKEAERNRHQEEIDNAVNTNSYEDSYDEENIPENNHTAEVSQEVPPKNRNSEGNTTDEEIDTETTVIDSNNFEEDYQEPVVQKTKQQQPNPLLDTIKNLNNGTAQVESLIKNKATIVEEKKEDTDKEGETETNATVSNETSEPTKSDSSNNNLNDLLNKLSKNTEKEIKNEDSYNDILNEIKDNYKENN